jgi:hypothetical protein
VVVARNGLVIHLHREHEKFVPLAAVVETRDCLRRGKTPGFEPFVKRLVEASR